MTEKKCVYVIGAGLSAGLGYPLTGDLLVRLWARIDSDMKNRLKRVIAFHHPEFDPERFESFPNVEQLLSEMLVNLELFDSTRRHGGTFTKDELKEIEQDFLLQVGDWFHEISAEVELAEPRKKWLKKFRDRVKQENAVIISFNWDLVLDDLLFGEDIGSDSYGLAKTRTKGPVLLKPHGSLNWFDEELGGYLGESKKTLIFGKENKGAVYAFREFRAPRSKVGRKYTPLIVPPVHLKKFDKPVFQKLWNECTGSLSTASKVVFLGYSMPDADLHAQFIMRCGFHNQIEGVLAEDNKRESPTGPAEVIIVNPDPAAARRIAGVAGPQCACRWYSEPAAEWIKRDE